MAITVCLVGTVTSFRMLSIARKSVRRGQLIWLLLSGVLGGSAIWATNFIAMLAFDPGIAGGYDPIVTALSLAVAVGGVCATAMAPIELQKPGRIALRAGIFAASCWATQYLGLASWEIPSPIAWRPEFVVGSLFICWALAMLAFWSFKRGRSLGRIVLASMVLGSGVLSLHFVGMMGLGIIAASARVHSTGSLSHGVLAIYVSVLSGLIFLAALVITWLGRRARHTALALLRSVTDVMPQGFVYFDADGRFVLGNQAYRRDVRQWGVELTPGVTTRTMLEQAMSQRARPLEETESDWVMSLRAAEGPGSGVRYQHLDDGRFLRIENCQVSAAGSVKVVSDITDLKRRTDDLAAARDAAEAAVRAKSTFLGNMSHELRTPMNGVIAVAELLGREDLTHRQTELVSIIRDSAATLDRVLCDLLEMARIEGNAVEIIAAPFDLAEAVLSVVDLHRPNAEKKGLSISVKAPAGVVLGDAVRLKQILANLVTNAVKFTENGQVEVTVLCRETCTVFSVTDTGLGFDENFKSRIFARFEQADGSTTRRFGGAGLGLAIAYDLAVRMGGELTCESTLGRGSSFHLSLPLVSADPLKTKEADIPYEPGHAQVLVVDDNPTNQRVLALLLEGVGIDVSLAGDGQEALDRWRADWFDAILMDIQMPVMDGLQATAAIRREEASAGRPYTPILVVSANALPEHVEASHAAGADGHISKPINPEKLYAALAGLDERGDSVAA